MNPELPHQPREERELQVTALLLGELNEADAASVRIAIANDPELQKLYSDLKQTIYLVREATVTASEPEGEQTEPLKLSDQRRKSLLTAFAIPPFKPEHIQRKRRLELSLIEVLVVLAIIGVLSAMLLPSLSKAKEKSTLAAVRNNMRHLETAKQVWASDNHQPADATPTLEDLKPYLGNRDEIASVKGERYVLGKVGEPVVAEIDAKDAKGAFGRMPANTTDSDSDLATVQVSAEGRLGYANTSDLETRNQQLQASHWGSSSAGNGGRKTPAAVTPLPRQSTITVSEQSLLEAPLTASRPTTEIVLPAGVEESAIASASGKEGEESFADRLARIKIRAASPVAGDSVVLAYSSPSAAQPEFTDPPLEKFAGSISSDEFALKQAHVKVDETLLGTTVSGYADTSFEWAAKEPAGPLASQTDGFNLNVISSSPSTADAIRDDTLSISGVNRYSGGAVANFGTFVANTDKSEAERHYDDPGAVAPQAQSGGGGMAGVPIIAQEPLAREKQADFGLGGKREMDAEWFGSLEHSPKPTKPGGESANNYRFYARTENEAVQSGNDGSNIVLPTTEPRSRASDQLLTSGLRNSPEAASVPAFAAYDGTPLNQGDAVSILEEKQVALEKQIAAARTDLERHRESLKITDATASGTGPTVSLHFASVQSLNSLTIESEAQLAQTESQYKQLQDLSQEELLKELPKLAPDAQFNELMVQLDLAQKSLTNAEKKYSVDSPQLQTSEALVEDLSRKLNERGEGVMQGLKRQSESLTAGVESLRDQLETTRQSDMARTKATQPYWEKKRELEVLQSFQKILETRLAMEKVDMALPRSGMVSIVDRAVPETNQSLLSGLGHALGKDYQATARIKLERSSGDIREFGDAGTSAAYDPYFIQTEFETMKSEAVLTNVIAKLGLDNKWAKESGGKNLTKEQAVEKLRQRLEFKPVRSTMFASIKANSDDPQEAAKIANAVAEAYNAHRLSQVQQASASGIKALKAQFDAQQEKITKVSKELAQLEATSRTSATNQNAPASKVALDTPLPRKPATNAPVPQPEIQTSENNFSTFSLNLSDVSFKLAAASLAQGQLPEAASIRSEEFINAFDYRDPEPPTGAPVAFAWERARYPFAHNRDLLRFSLKTAAAGRSAGRPLNIVLLLDNSGSMERADRVQIIREALRVLASQLQPQDKFSVITFARTPRLVVDGVPGNQAGEVAQQVGGLTPEGGTNLEAAMNLAYQTALRHYLANGINRVVVLTDGAANLGEVEPELLKQQVEANRKQGIALDCFGIGWEGFNDDLLEVLSRNGDGRYGFINSPQEAATDFAGQLAGALKVAASDVKVQVEFNPARVTAYRQIGYAKHQLTKEQFRDNTVDAAEIAAQEAGNALYTVEVNPTGSGPLGTVRVRYKVPGTTDYREQSWDVPYAGSAVALDQASPAMRLAATASAFSEWLVVSPYAGEVTPDALLKTLSGVPEVFGADPRPTKLERMIEQARSIGGK